MRRVGKRGRLPPPSDNGGDGPAKKPRLGDRSVSKIPPKGANKFENDLAGLVRFVAKKVRTNEADQLSGRTSPGPVKNE